VVGVEVPVSLAFGIAADLDDPQMERTIVSEAVNGALPLGWS
jgi:hypothetical protein